MKENVFDHSQRQPYWKRFYNSLGLWIFLYLMIISSGLYIIAVDFSFEPYWQMKHHSKNISKTPSNSANESAKINTQKSSRSNTMVSNVKRTPSTD